MIRVCKVDECLGEQHKQVSYDCQDAVHVLKNLRMGTGLISY